MNTSVASNRWPAKTRASSSTTAVCAPESLPPGASEVLSSTLVGTRIVVTANDHQPIGISSGQPRDHAESRRRRAVGMDKRVKPYLKSRDGAVLIEDEIAS